MVELNVHNVPDMQQIASILIQSHFNWFEVMDRMVKEEDEGGIQEVQQVSDNCFAMAKLTCMSDEERQLLNQSYQAFSCDMVARCQYQSKVDALNGMVVSDSEKYVELSLTSEHLRDVVSK